MEENFVLKFFYTMRSRTGMIHVNNFHSFGVCKTIFFAISFSNTKGFSFRLYILLCKCLQYINEAWNHG